MAVLATMTTAEASVAIPQVKVAILPTGAIEQHGPHLEVQCDWAVASAMANRLEADLGAVALLVPGIPYGMSEHHTKFAGSMTLTYETFSGFLTDVAMNLKRQGIRKVIVVNGHGGNIEPVKTTARALRRDHGILMAHAMWARLSGAEVAARMPGRDLYNHACEIETSIALHLAPGIVREIPTTIGDRVAANGHTDPPHGVVDLPTWFHQWTTDGALGDPREATTELGAQLLEPGYDRLLAFARWFCDEPLPEGMADV